MERRDFLQSLVGGIATLAAVRTWPFRGSANAYVITLAPALGSLVTGEQAYFTTTNANTGASTINVNGLGVKNITKFGTKTLLGAVSIEVTALRV